MFRIPATIGALRSACHHSTLAINRSPATKIGYVAAATVKLPSTVSHNRAYSSTATISSSSSSSSTSDAVKIYTGSMSGKFWRVKIFSASTSVLGICAQPVLIEKGAAIAGTAGVVALCSVAGFFAFVTPVLLHLVVKKYVIEMDYNRTTDEYTATTISLLMRKKKTTFRVSDIVIPEIPGMFTSFKVGKGQIPLFVDASDFSDLHHYARFMGFDKPVDFKLESDDIGQGAGSRDATHKKTDVK